MRPRAVHRAILALAIAAAGCSAPRVDRGVCGNGVVEPGEDCDSTDPRCDKCGITCRVTDDCLAYDARGGTAGFVCGPDGFCHAPAGAFERAGEVALPVTSLRVTGVNADGFGDVLAESQTAVTVLFGDRGAGLSKSADLLTPFPQGPATYADLDGDGSLDVLAPTADGIVAFTTPFGVPSPYPFPSFIPDAMGKPLFVQPIIDGHLGIIGTSPLASDRRLAYLVLDVRSAPPMQLGQLPLCGATEDEFSADDVDVFPLGPREQIVAVTIRPAGQPARLCVISVEPNGASYTIAPIAFTPTGAPAARAVLANLRGQPCPSLLVPQAGGLLEYPPQSPAVPCSFAGAPVALAGAPPGAAPVGTAPLVPPVAGLGGFAVALTTGVYGYSPSDGKLVELYRSDRALGAVRSADLDGDGDVDLIASGQQIDDIDLIERRGGSYAYALRFQTAGPVVAFLLGDFDGNEIPDVAYVERGVGEERLVIAYGTRDQLLPGVTVGTFARVRSVVEASIPDSTDRTGVISDLAVLFDAGAASQLALLHGSPQRTMLAYFDPRQPPTDPDSIFRGVVAGNFGGDGGGNDVLAVEELGPTKLYVSRGARSGELEAGGIPSRSSVIVSCEGPGPLPPDPFCIRNARYAPWSMSSAHDLVVGIDLERDVILFDPLALGPDSEAPLLRFADRLIAPPGAVVRALQTIRLADGSQRLLASFASPEAVVPRTTAVNLCAIEAPEAGPTCLDLGAAVSAAVGEEVRCVDAGQARVARAGRFQPPDREGEELVVLCRRSPGGGALFRVSSDGAIVAPLLELTGGDAMQVGDVTGDGIADLIVIDRSFAVPLVRVFRQCTSRDLECGGVAGAALGVSP